MPLWRSIHHHQGKDLAFAAFVPNFDLPLISQDDLLNGEIVASCLSCSLILRVVYEVDDIENIIKSKERQTNKATELLVKN